MYRKYFEEYVPKEAKKAQRRIIIIGSILGFLVALGVGLIIAKVLNLI